MDADLHDLTHIALDDNPIERRFADTPLLELEMAESGA